jgi:phytoene synthase
VLVLEKRPMLGGAGCPSYLSSRFLPYAERRAVWAVYAFCRTADDIVDRNTGAAERLTALNEWEIQLQAAYAGRASTPIFTALADAAARFGVPLHAALDLLRGAGWTSRSTATRPIASSPTTATSSYPPSAC